MQRNLTTFLNVGSGDELNHSQSDLTSAIKGENRNVSEASYKVSWHIARCGEAHTIAENLIPFV